MNANSLKIVAKLARNSCIFWKTSFPKTAVSVYFFSFIKAEFPSRSFEHESVNRDNWNLMFCYSKLTRKPARGNIWFICGAGVVLFKDYAPGTKWKMKRIGVLAACVIFGAWKIKKINKYKRFAGMSGNMAHN